MANPQDSDSQSIPYFQELFDRPFVLLFAGLCVMFLFYTGWGMYEIVTLPQSSLP